VVFPAFKDKSLNYMKNLLKKWWAKRLDRYYLKTRWYLIVDLILLTTFLTLLLVFFYLRYQPPIPVDTTSVKHTPKTEINVDGNSLVIESEVDRVNIYAEKEFKLKIKATNTGKNNLTNVDLSLLLNNNKFSFSRIKSLSPTSEFKVSGRKITLVNLPVGATSEIELSLLLKNLPDSPRSILWRIGGSYKEANLNKEVSYQLPDLKLVSAVIVKATAYYNSPQGDQLGSGPIPPQVSMPTNYWVFFNLNNIGNELGDLEVKARLADNVAFYDNKALSAGELSYDLERRELTWKVNRVEAIQDGYRVGFELQLIPGENQFGLVPALLNNLSFSARDLYSQEKISGQLPVVDTNLTFDLINKGKGVVVK
jgi:hypothetical protein